MTQEQENGSQHRPHHDGEGESSEIDLPPVSPIVYLPGQVVITNPKVAVTLPTLKYGYRKEKAEWPELVQIINVDHDIPRMSRSQQQQHHYEVVRYHMNEQYQSGTDYILISKFGYDSIKDPNTGKWQAVKPLTNVTEKILILNDFPYCVEDRVVHYVLWKREGSIDESEIVDARKELAERLHTEDILFWANPLNLQSLPEIHHVHFLCLLPEWGGQT
jgi:hypothetical protein